MTVPEPVPSLHLHSSIEFLKRHPLYEVEKVYEHRRNDWPHVPPTNAMMDRIEHVPIRNARDTNCSMSDHGFYCMKMETSLQPEDFQNTTIVGEHYIPEITEAVRELLKASRVQAYDFTVRKRHPEYPFLKADDVTENNRQPAYGAHIDETFANAERIIHKLNPSDHEALLKGRWQSVIAWRPLKGPVRDWPLALCDIRSVDAKADLQACDIVDPENVSEEYVLHYSPDLRWYYLEDQMPNEVWIMLQSDSKGSIGVPHSSFPHPATTAQDHLRESVDVHMMVYYDD